MSKAKENRINSLAVAFLEKQQIQPNIFADQIIRGYKEGYHQAEKDNELVESAEEVDAQINSQNEAIKQLNRALNSMEHGGHLPLDEDRMVPKEEVDSMAEEISKDCKKEIDRQFDEIVDKYLYGKDSEMVDIDDLPLYDCRIQYASIEGAIKAHAEDYSFNIESELFQQLTPEQQKMWRKEIERAVLSGAYSGLNLARDERYEENRQDESVSEELEEATKNHAVERYRATRDMVLAEKCKWSFKEGANWKREQIVKENMLLPFKEYDNLMESINKRKKEGYEAGYKQGLVDSKSE